MHFLNIFHIFVLVWASLAVADTTTSTSSTSTISTVSPTLVWVTGTDSKGVTQTTKSEYTQEFTSFYSTVVQPSSGSAGMSTLSGSVGGIRTYTRSTINGAEAGPSAGVIVSTILPLLSAFFGLFMI